MSQNSDCYRCRPYHGKELDVFMEARRWKSRLRDELRGFVSGDVIEVGAGIGGTTIALRTLQHRTWTCLEPDPRLANRLAEYLTAEGADPQVEVATGTLEELPEHRQFDSILYIDVLEHIDIDRRELSLAAPRLRPEGHLIVLSPAHQWLYTPFDNAIGHYRRYSASTIRALTPDTLLLDRLRYLDSVGLCASLANRFLLKADTPSRQQIQFWDRVMVPLSKWLDPLLAYRIGKSILAVWRRPQDEL